MLKSRRKHLALLGFRSPAAVPLSWTRPPKGLSSRPSRLKEAAMPQSERAYRNVLELIGNTPMVELTRLERGRCAALRQAREPEPGRLDQGPHRALDDRGGRVPRAAQARRRADRGDRRQYRPRLGARRRAEGLQAHPRHPRQDEPGEDLPSARARRRGDPHPLGRGQGSSGILSGHGGAFSPRDPRRLLRQPVRQSRQPAGPRGDDRPRDLVADGGQARCGRLRRRLRRHLDRPLALFREDGSRGRDDSRRPRGLGAGRLCQERQGRQSVRLLARRGHRRGFRTARLPISRASSAPTSSRTARPCSSAARSLRKEGILAGSSSGTLLAAALRYCREESARSASSPSCATAGTNISPRCTTTTGCSIRASSSAPSARRLERPHLPPAPPARDRHGQARRHPHDRLAAG